MLKVTKLVLHFYLFFFFLRGSQILLWLNYIFSPLFIKGYAGLEKITYSHILDKKMLIFACLIIKDRPKRGLGLPGPKKKKMRKNFGPL